VTAFCGLALGTTAAGQTAVDELRRRLDNMELTMAGCGREAANLNYQLKLAQMEMNAAPANESPERTKARRNALAALKASIAKYNSIAKGCKTEIDWLKARLASEMKKQPGLTDGGAGHGPAAVLRKFRDRLTGFEGRFSEMQLQRDEAVKASNSSLWNWPR
jgi:chromosome segregation ATPase